MVCEKCEKKLSKNVQTDVWKAGARNSIESGGKKVGENKLLTSKKDRFQPYGDAKQFTACRVCKTKVHQRGSNYCQRCAYSVGICAMCGKKMLDTKNYKQSSV